MLRFKFAILSAVLPLALGSCKVIEGVLNAPYIYEMEAYCGNYSSFMQLFSDQALTLIKPSEEYGGYSSTFTYEGDKRMADALQEIKPTLLESPVKVGDMIGRELVQYRIISSLTYIYFCKLDFYIDEKSDYLFDLYLHHKYAGFRRSIYSITKQEYQTIGETFTLVFEDCAERGHDIESDSESSVSEEKARSLRITQALR